MSNAIQRLKESLAADPDNVGLLDEVISGLRAEGAWDDLTTLLESAAARIADPSVRVRALLHASWAALQAGRSEGDVGRYLAGVGNAALPYEALTGVLRQAFLEGGDWAQLATVSATLIGHAEGLLKAHLEFFTGRLCEDRLADPKKAIKLYQMAWKTSQGQFVDPLVYARALYEAQENWSNAAKVLRLQIQHTGPARAKARLLVDLGKTLLWDKLGDKDAGIEALREALALDPDLESIRQTLRDEGVLPHESTHDAETLDADEGDDGMPMMPGARRAVVETADDEDIEEVVETAQTEEVETEASEAEGRETEAVEPEAAEPEATEPEATEPEATEPEAAELEAAEPEAAEPEAAEPEAAELEAAEPEAAELEAAEPEAADTQAEPAAQSADAARAGVAEVPEAVGADVSAEGSRAGEEVLERWSVASFALDEGGSSAAQRAVTELSGGTLDDRLLAAEIRWVQGADIQDTLEFAVDLLVDAGDRSEEAVEHIVALWGCERAFLRSLAGVVGDELPPRARYALWAYGAGDEQVAGTLVAALGEFAAGEGEALGYARKGNWRKAGQAVEGDAPRRYPGVDAEIAQFRVQILHALAVGQDDKALDAARRILRKDKGDAFARRVSRSLLRSLERWPQLVDAWKQEAEALGAHQSSAKSFFLRCAMAVYRDVLQQEMLVMQAYAALVEVEPNNAVLLDEYGSLLEKLQRFPDLLEVKRRQASLAAPGEPRLAALKALAVFLVERFSNHQEAIKAYEQMLEVDPACVEALVALEDLYEKRREFDKLLSVKDQLVALDGDPVAQVRRLRESADLAATRMRNVTLALGQWRRVLEIAPEDASALEAMEQLLEREKDYEGLAEVLERRAPLVADHGQRAILLLKWAQLLQDRVKDVGRAVEVYEELLALDDSNLRAREALKKGYVELRRWDALEDLFERLDAWPEFVRLVEGASGDADSDAEKVDLLRRASRVWTQRLGMPERAVKGLERILELEPDDLESAQGLAAFYEERRDFKRLAPMLEILLEHTTLSEERFALEKKLGLLFHESLRQPAEAFRWLGAALRSKPSEVELVAALETVARSTDSLPAFVDLLLEAQDSARSEDASGAVLRALGWAAAQVQERDLQDLDGALASYATLWDLDGSDREVLGALDRVHVAREDWDSLLGVLDAWDALAQSDDERVALLRRRASLQEKERDDVPAAIAAHRHVLELLSGDEQALSELRRLYRAGDDAPGLVATLAAWVDVVEAGERWEEANALRLEWAEVLANELMVPSDALRVVAPVLEREPGHGPAVELVWSLVADDAVRGAAAALVETHVELLGQWDRFVEIQEVLVEAAERADERATRLAAAARAWEEELDNPEESFDAWSRALRARPSDADARAALERLADALSAWETLIALYEELVDGNSLEDPAARVTFLARASGFAERGLGDLAEAIRLERRVLAEDPQRVASYQRLDGLLESEERWEELLENYGQRLLLLQELHEARDLRFLMASLCEGALEDPERAIAFLQEIVAQEPDQDQALSELDRLFGQVGDGVRQAEVVQARLGLVERGSAAFCALQNRLAGLVEEELGDTPRAVALLAEVLSLVPEDEDAVSHLERLVAEESHGLAAGSVLDTHYQALEAWGPLARLLRALVPMVQSREEARGLLERLVRLEEEALGDAAGAWATAREAVSEDIEHAWMVDAVFRMAEDAGRWDELLAFLQPVAEEAADPTVGAAVLRRIAGLRERLEDVAGAVALWESLYESFPSEVDALDCLERLHGQAEAWASLADVLARKAEHPAYAGRADERRALILRAADLHERVLEQPEEAIGLLEALLAALPQDREVLEALNRLYAGVERWEERVDMLERLLALGGARDEQRALLAAVAETLHRDLEDAHRAVGAFERMLSLDEGDVAAMEGLAALHRETENAPALIDVLRRRLALERGAEDRVRLLREIARIEEQDLLDSAGAVNDYAAALALDPTSRETRAALWAMVERGDEVVRVADLLEPLFQSEEGWTELAALLRVRIRHAELPTQRAGLLRTLAEVLADRLGDFEASMDTRAEAARDAWIPEDVDALEALAEQTGRWDDAVATALEIVDQMMDPALRLTTLQRIARWQLDQLGNAAAALELYHRAHDEAPGERAPLEALRALYAGGGHAEPLVETLRKLLGLAHDASDRRTLRLSLATTLRDALGETYDTVQVLREMLAEDARDEEAHRLIAAMVEGGEELEELGLLLEPLYRANAQWDRLEALFLAKLGVEEPGAERQRLLVALADVRLEHLDQPLGALAALGEALRDEPGDLALRERIEELAAGEQAWNELWGIYHDVLSQEDLGDSERHEITFRLGQVIEEKIGDDENAEVVYRAALAIEPLDDRILAALDGLLTRQERWSELCELLESRREANFDPTAQAEIISRRARVFEDRLGDLAGAVGAWRDLLDANPGSGAALESLRKLYLQTEAWEPLYDTLDQLSMHAADEATRVALWRDMARLAAGALGQAQDAMDMWSRVLSVHDGDVEALEQLVRLYEAEEQYHELALTLGRLVDLTADAQARLSLQRRLGVLFAERLEMDGQAISVFEAILKADQHDRDALGWLRVLYERSGESQRLAQTLETLLAIGALQTEAETMRALEELGRLYSDALMQPQPAVRAWRRLLEASPGHDEALDRLEQLYEQAQAWRDLAGILQQRVAREGEPDERLELLRRLARLWQDRAQDVDEAVAAWDRVIEESGLEDLEAVSQLDALLTAAQRWEDLVGLLVERVDVVEPGFERRELLRRAGVLYEEQLGLAEGAYLLAVRALEEEPDEPGLLENAERLAGVAGQWEDFVRRLGELSQRVGAESGEAETLPLQLAAGRVQELHLGRPDMAEVYYDRALELDPENEEVLNALERIYETLESWSDLARVLRVRAALSFDPTVQRALWVRAAELAEVRVGDAAGAVSDWLAVWDLDEQDAEAPSALDRIYRAGERWADLVGLLERRASSVYDPGLLVPLRREIGLLWREQLGDVDRAIEAFEDLLSAVPQDREALEALEELYIERGDWQACAHNIETQLMLPVDSARRVELLLTLALLQEQKLDDIDRAVDALRQVTQVDAGHVPAILELERIFREQGRLEELVEALELHVNALGTAEEQAEVLALMAHHLREHLDDPYRAVAAYERILALLPGHAATLRALAALRRELGNVQGAIEALDALAAADGLDVSERAQAWTDAAALCVEGLGQVEAALQRLQAALDLDPAHLGALDALAKAYMVGGRWQEALDVLRRRIDYTDDLQERSKRLAQQGEILELQLERLEDAKQMYVEAIDLDPTNEYAAAPLAEIFLREERWERAKPLLELLLRLADDRGDEDAVTALYLALGRACTSLEQEEDAKRAFEAVLTRRPDIIEAQVGLARLYDASGRGEDAFALIDALLTQHRASLDAATVGDLLLRAAKLQERAGRLQEARVLYEEVVEMVPGAEEALRGLMRTLDETRDAHALLRCRERLARVVADELERFQLWVQVGDAWRREGRAEQAVESYKCALEVDDASLVVLIKLLEAFNELENWPRAVEVLGRLATIEKDPSKASRYFMTAAQIFIDEMQDLERAIQFYNLALDAYTHRLEAFEAVVKLLTAARDWQGLERNYRKMIERVRGDGNRAALANAELLLYRGLGEIYRSRLGNVDHAIAAFRLALDMAPDDVETYHILAELYERAGKRGDEVIELHRRLIAHAPLQGESYEALLRSYLALPDRKDAAWCVASAMQVVREQHEEARRFYNNFLRAAAGPLTRQADDSVWRLVEHPDVDANLSKLFALLAVHLRSVYKTELKDWRLKKGDLIRYQKEAAAHGDQLLLGKELQVALWAFHMSQPSLYAGQDYRGLVTMNTDPWSLVAGNDVLSGRNEREVRFLVGRAVALLRPEYFLASLGSKDMLEELFYGAFGYFTNQLPPWDADRVERTREYVLAVRRLPDPVLAQLRQPIEQFIAAGKRPSLSRWMTAVDHTANRLGLVLCSDVKRAIACVSSDPRPIGQATPNEKLRELLAFSISEELFQLRRDLGLAVGASG